MYTQRHISRQKVNFRQVNFNRNTQISRQLVKYDVYNIKFNLISCERLLNKDKS